MAKARPIPGLSAELSYSEAAVRTIEVRSAELFEQAAGVLDVGKIEAVHAMRVATRRLRAVLEFYEPCLDREQLRPVLGQVCDLADALGQRRDPDVEILALTQFAAGATDSERPGIERFIERTRELQQQANTELEAMLAQIEQDGLRERLAGLIEPPAAEPETVAEPAAGPIGDPAAAAPDDSEQPARGGWLRRR